MNSSPIDAAPSALGTMAQTNPTSDHLLNLHGFVFQNYGSLTDACFTAHPELPFWEPEQIISALIRDLHRYGGPSVEADFLHWAARYVAHEATRVEIHGRLMSEHNKLLRAAIRECRWTSATDCAVTDDDILSEVSWLIWQRAHSLDKRGHARTSTRLYGLVKKHVYQYHNARNRRRIKAVTRHLDRGGSLGCEFLSPGELAAMAADEREDTA